MIARITTLLLALALMATVPVGTALAASDCRAAAATLADRADGQGDCDECGSKPGCDTFCAPLCHAITQNPAVVPVASLWNEPAPMAIVVELLLKSTGPEPPPPRTSLLA